MKDVFDYQVLCRKCGLVMKQDTIAKNGFELRLLKCVDCGEKLIHPGDLKDYENFSNLQNKVFKVKLRLVGNSYAVSIPKEIVEFMREQEKMLDNMVRLAFEDCGRLSLRFNSEE
jgi:hypothetical protein